MPAQRPRERHGISALAGGFVVVLSIALVAFARPSDALAPVGAAPGESQGPSVSGSLPLPPQQAAQVGATTAAGFALRLAGSGGGLPAPGPAALAPLPAGPPDPSAATRVAAPRP